MVQQGASTLWERWDGLGSQNHIMFGDISAWFYEYLAGIQPDIENPGFKHFFVKPFLPHSLDSVCASHRSPYGLIESSWEQDELGVEFSVTVPANSSATFICPDKEFAAIRHNGQELEIQDQPSGYKLHLKSGEHSILLSQ